MKRAEFIRNIIAKSLGVIWILDGLCQFQPKMFGPDFVSAILAPTLGNQPALLRSIIAFGTSVWNMNPIAANTVAALMQIAIGALLLCSLSSTKFKTGLYLSIAWGLIIWIFGEGAGMVFTGSASFYTGAPGAVFIYVVLSLLLLIPKTADVERFPRIAGLTFFAGSLLQLQPAFWTTDGIQSIFAGSASENMAALHGLPAYLSNLLGGNPSLSNFLLYNILLIVGFALLYKPNRVTGSIALVVLFFVWWLGQDFGGLSTLMMGTCTDVNTAPLLALCLVPLFVPSVVGQRFPAAHAQ